MYVGLIVCMFVCIYIRMIMYCLINFPIIYIPSLSPQQFICDHRYVYIYTYIHNVTLHSIPLHYIKLSYISKYLSIIPIKLLALYPHFFKGKTINHQNGLSIAISPLEMSILRRSPYFQGQRQIICSVSHIPLISTFYPKNDYDMTI